MKSKGFLASKWFLMTKRSASLKGGNILERKAKSVGKMPDVKWIVSLHS